jgi:signal transduction histidine kinase/ligand-binding sensor domain-containing protein
MKKLFLILLLVGSGHFTFSQQIHFEPVHYKGDGSANNFTMLTQDHLGYIWITSSESGIYRYDGTDFINFQHNNKNANTVASNYTFCIYADSANNLWIGTYGAGLDLFNPVIDSFTHYRHDPKNNLSLSNDTVISILEDHLGNIWIGTRGGGLDLLDRKSGGFRHYFHQENISSSLSNNKVFTIYEDRQGTLWVGCGSLFDAKQDGGLNRFDRATGGFTRFLHDPADPNSMATNKVKALFEDSKGNFWVGTSGDGLHIMDRQKGIFRHFYYDSLHPEKLSRPPISYDQDMISFIKEDELGGIWIGTVAAGINRYNPISDKLTHFGFTNGNKNRIYGTDTTSGFYDISAGSAMLSKDGMLWITVQFKSSHAVLYKVNMLAKTVPFYKTNGQEANSFYMGPDSILWIGAGNGLLRKDLNQNKERLLFSDPRVAEVPSAQTVSVIRADQGKILWLGTQGGGLIRYNTITGDTIRYRFNPKIESSLRNDTIYSMCLDHNDDLWVGTYVGLDKMDKQTGGFKHIGLENPKVDAQNTVICIRENQDSNLWVGTGYGLYRINTVNGNKIRILKNAYVGTIFIDAKNQVWIGADTTKRNASQSLYRLDRNRNQFESFIVPNTGQHVNNVFDIMEDNNGSLWISTTDAIVKINEHRDLVMSYGPEFGVHRNNFGTGDNFKTVRGQLFFGDEQGYYTFFPADLNNETKPLLNFTGFKLNGTEIAPAQNGVLKHPIWQTGEINLSYNQNIFSIEFKGINYQNSEGVKYQYFLQNYDQNWHKLSVDNSAYYFNVPTGKYIFLVRGYNDAGGWSERSIAILISPPWWKTWWAYTIWALSVIAAIWGITSYRSRTLRSENRLLEERVTRRTSQLQQSLEELKSTQTQLIQSEKMASLGELTAGIAHEIQNPLNFMNNFSEVNKELIDEMEQEMDNGNLGDAKTIAKNIRENEEKISHHGKRADAIVKGMLQHSRASTGQKEPTDINALADEYLRLSYQGLRAKDKPFNATLQTDFDPTIRKINIIPQDIGRVLLNLYNNAFYVLSEKKRQIPEGYDPTLSVSTKKIDGMVEIRVKDNGNGIPQKILDKIFQPFFTTKPTGQGTGLGLSLSYDTIKAYGGELKVESKEGDGAEFVVLIPAYINPESPIFLSLIRD